MIKVDVFISSAEGKTISDRFSIDWTKSFERIKIPYRKKGCDEKKVCSNCVIEPKMNCFNCEVERSCETCLDQKTQKKTYFTDFNIIKMKHPNENQQMLPFYIGEYEHKQNKFDFESVKEVLMEVDEKMVVERCFERIYKSIECMA